MGPPIRHAGALPCPILAVAIPMVIPSFGALLVAAPGLETLQLAPCAAALRAAHTLPAVASTTHLRPRAAVCAEVHAEAFCR